MPKHGKKYNKSVENLDMQAKLPVEDAVSKALASAFAKFDETVDLALRLGVDPKYSDQMVRGAVALPHGLGKTVRVAVFCKGDKEAEARNAGADIVGANCGNGIERMIEIVTLMRSVNKDIPILIHANAGLPQSIDGKDVFPETPEDMAEAAPRLAKAGANIIGGCCGTTPAHIKAMKEALTAGV